MYTLNCSSEVIYIVYWEYTLSRRVSVNSKSPDYGYTINECKYTGGMVSCTGNSRISTLTGERAKASFSKFALVIGRRRVTVSEWE